MEGYAADPTDNVQADFIDWRERQYFGKNTAQTIGLSLVGSDGTTPVNPDGLVLFTLYRDNPTGAPTQVFQRTATVMGTGLFEIALTAVDTGVTANYTGVWSYAMNAIAETYEVYLIVGESNPAYDRLGQEFQEVVDHVWTRFADLFDSASGGPHLQMYYQAHWSRGRMAQLMGMALRRLNVISQPHQTYTLDGAGGTKFPVLQWGGLLEVATYIEAIKHLRRSYLEQPEVQTTITRLDRIRYFDRWGEMLDGEEHDLKSSLENFKKDSMFLGAPAVLVSGGVYGRYAPTRIAGSVAARPRYYTRFYA